jgi:hypothetical protein
MNADVLNVLEWVGAVVVFLVLLWLVDGLLFGVVNRFGTRKTDSPHRVGTELPRIKE